MSAPAPATVPATSPDAGGEAAPSRSQRRGRRFALAGLAVGLVAAVLAGTALGAYAIPLGDIVASVARRLGFAVAAAPDAVAESVLWQVRLPRVALAVVVGAALGVAGALLQGAFRNPLAEPGVIGVSAGAAVGAAAVVVGGVAVGAWAVTAGAFVGGLGTTALVYALARSGGRTEVVTLVLTGVAVNALGGAVIGLLTFLSDDTQLRALVFWQLGSLGGATWGAVAAVAPVALLGLVLAPRFGRALDLLALGERVAVHLGVDVRRLRFALVAVVALLTAAAVAMAGVLTFVGLVVPHLVRLAFGPRHDVLLPASGLLGALVLVLADLVARTVAAPAELPLGVLTALLGAPFFLWLLVRARQRDGGWA